ncbi:MAG: hypothetical protein K2Q25_07475 [Mycobacteriaceae bacterium]|nr:hypothetical protein [Mycobacteriaceae bacterium]
MPLFGVPYGIGDSPDWGSQLSSSMSKCAAAYDKLTSATPKITDWYSAASQEYTLDVQSLQYVAAQAGIDAVLTTFVTQSQSLDTQLQQWISTQALGVEIMQCCLASLTVGLVICESIALAMEASFGLGMSRGFQIAMATTAITGALGIVMTMAIWSHTIQGHIDGVANAYDDLLTQIPSSVPSVSPYGGSLAQASATPWFVDVNLSASTDEPTDTTMATSSGRHHARPPALTDFRDSPPPSSAPRPESAAATTQAAQPPEAAPVSSVPLVAAAQTTPSPSVPSQAAAAAPQRHPANWADTQARSLAPAKAMPAEDIDPAAAAGVADAERVPVGVGSSSPDQAAPAKPSDGRRISSPAAQNPERKA